ncbi:MAG: hypothetical protein AB7V50_04440 [Vampirovibrionia bacterium]
MGLSASNIAVRNNYLYRHSLTPLANQDAISRGAYSIPSPDPLAPSTTAYGTNANPLDGGPVYVNSAQVLAQNAVTSSNISVTQSSIETGSNLQKAISTIAEQSTASRFNTNNNVFTTNKTANVQTANNTKTFSPISTSSNVRTQSPVFQSQMVVTGRNANINSQQAANIATVNANYNVNLSQQGTQAIKALQSAAANAASQNASMFAKVDGTIPLAAASISDFSVTTPSTSNVNSQDNLINTFNKLMNGDGHGGGGATLAQSQEKEHSQQGQQQQQHPFASKPKEDKRKKGLDFMA